MPQGIALKNKKKKIIINLCALRIGYNFFYYNFALSIMWLKDIKSGDTQIEKGYCGKIKFYLKINLLRKNNCIL